MTARQRSHPTFKLHEDEQQLYKDFIDEVIADYANLKNSDKRQLDLAATEYILAVRLQADEIETGRVHLSQRFSHLQHMRTLLNDMGLSRSSRMKEKQPTSNEADQLRELLFSISADEPTTKNGKK